MPLRRQRFSAVPASTAASSSQPAPETPAPQTAETHRRDFLARAAAAVGAGLLALAGQPALPGGEQARAATSSLDPFIGEIMLFAGNFPPRGYAFCEGQIMSIAQNTALFSLVGTMYGGNGINTFGLPDLRGRAPIHAGQGPGLPNFDQGEMGGETTHTLTLAELPGHTHAAYADAGNGVSTGPAGALPAHNPSGTPSYGPNPTTTLAANAIGIAGLNQPHNVMSPYLAMRWCICLEGVYPSRD